jgi:hypothetical protein
MMEKMAPPWYPSLTHACSGSHVQHRRAVLWWCPFGRSPLARVAAQLSFSVSPSPWLGFLCPARWRDLFLHDDGV